MSQAINRREFLRGAAMAAAGILAASCARATPQVIEKPVTVVVEKQVPVEKEVIKTVVVEKEKPVEKVVKETVVVEKPVTVEKVVKETVVQEKVITATPVKMKYKEAPMLAGLVQAGKLPPVDERLPEEPMVVPVVEEIGQYGGTWHRLAVSAGDVRTPDRLMADNLVHWDRFGTTIYPNVAKSYEVSPDGKQFTFKLRKGMKWSDGHPFTADDVLWWPLHVLTNKELAPTYPAWLQLGGQEMKAEKIDDYTVRFTFAAPGGVILYQLASFHGLDFGVYPAHYLKQFHVDFVDKAKLEKMAKDAGFDFWYQLYNNKGSQSAARSNVDLPVIHAWKLTVPPPKQPIVMERNPYYYKVDPAGNQLPYIDRIEHMIVQGAKEVNLRAMQGEVDMQLRHMTFDNYPLFMENRKKGDYRILLWQRGYITDAMIIPFVGHKDPLMRSILGDKRFHWALSLGIKRQEIIDSIYLGATEPNQISPLPTSPFYWEEQAKNMIEYDPDRANKYLDEMGLTKRDAEGYRLRPDGKRLTIVFEYAPVFGAWGPIAELLAAHWKVLGIELIVKEIDRNLYDTRRQTGEIDMSMWTTSGEFNPLLENTSPFITWHGGQVFQNWYLSRGKEGEEPPEYMKKQFEYFDAAKSTIDPKEQQALFRKILEIFKEQMTHIGICTAPPEVVVVKNNFRNVPEQAVSDWPLLTPSNTHPEQYFIKQT